MATVHGSCLCNDVTWEADGPFELMSHCHCGRCRKCHGTAFSTTVIAPEARFRYTGGHDRVVAFAPEGLFPRPFCGRCGAGVPAPPSNGQVVLNAGSLDEDPGLRPLARIFVGSNAPWYELFDDLPRFDAWPPGFDFPALADPPREPAPPGVVRGSCLCGGVAFAIEGPATTARYCHCTRCRKARAAAHNTNLVTPIAATRFTRGADRVRTYKLPEARFFSQSFCADCGGKLPRHDEGRGIAIVPMGALDDDPGMRAVCQIFVGSKAPWVELDPKLQPYDGPLPA
jgi:hypothetical protein